jgi:hypothetical protein
MIPMTINTTNALIRASNALFFNRAAMKFSSVDATCTGRCRDRWMQVKFSLPVKVSINPLNENSYFVHSSN